MSYIIVCRSASGPLIPVTSDADDIEIAEFDTMEDAMEAVKETVCCRIWPFHVLEVEL